jgi:hypothetical protein
MKQTANSPYKIDQKFQETGEKFCNKIDKSTVLRFLHQDHSLLAMQVTLTSTMMTQVLIKLNTEAPSSYHQNARPTATLTYVDQHKEKLFS